MKKKLLFVLTVIFVLSICLFGFSACGESGNDSSGDGAKPTPGETQTVTVSFVVDDSVLATKEITSGSGITDVPTVPEKTGYVGTWSVSDLTNITTDTTVNAVYTAKTYTLTFDYDGADGDNTLESKTVTYNQEIGELPEPTKTNYNFVKWINGATEIEYTSSTIWDTDADGTIIAIWLEKLCFTLNSNGTAYSVSKGSCTDAIVAIPKTHKGLPVTSIEEDAFSDYDSLTSITIPDSVTSIGENAFKNCGSLTSLVIPDSVTSIGSDAFSGCGSLEEITIPFVGATAGVTSSDTYQYPFGYIFGESDYKGGIATEQCYYGSSTSSTTNSTYYIPSSLKKVTVTGGNILYGAFNNCTSLTNILIPDGITSISEYTFKNCSSLTSIVIPDSVTSIGSYAFCDCSSLKSVTLPNSVISIGSYAFDNCSSLTSVIIPDSVTNIGSYAFYGCTSLTSVTIGSGVTSIGEDGYSVFYNCYRLVEVINKSNLTIEKGSSDNGRVGEYALKVKISGESDIVNQDDYLFYTYEGINYLIGYVGTETALILPDKYNGESYEIYKCAFYNCSLLTSITIGNSITSIRGSAFAYCTSLTSVTIPDSVTSIGGSAFV